MAVNSLWEALLIKPSYNQLQYDWRYRLFDQLTIAQERWLPFIESQDMRQIFDNMRIYRTFRQLGYSVDISRVALQVFLCANQ